MMGQKHAQSQVLRLNGLRILLVEDEFYIADELRRSLEAAGVTVVGPHGTVQSAVAAVDEGGFDCAVLDLNLHGDSAAPVADILRERGIPFAISTGYGSGAVPDHLKDAPRIEKPFEPQALLELVAQSPCCAKSADQDC